MNLSSDGSSDGEPATSAAAAELARWYTSHAVVRRLWAIEEIEAIRIVLALEPTVDGADAQPAWLASSSTWAQELQLRMHKIVRLELLDEPTHIKLPLERDCVLIAEVAWRDPSAWVD